MKSIQEQIANSTCYGVAYDGTVKECKICEIREQCKAKCNGENTEKPEKPEKLEKLEVKGTKKTMAELVKEKDAEKEAKATKAAKPESPLKEEDKEKALADKKTKTTDKKSSEKKEPAKTQGSNNSSDIPDFKGMSLEELEKLADERGADDSWKKYDNSGIRRMRVTMAIKKTY